MSETKEQLVYINWREIQRRWSKLGLTLVAVLYWVAMLALIFEGLRIALYAINLPASGWSWVRVGSLMGLEAAAVVLLTLVRQQQRAQEWSRLLLIFVLSIVSYVTLRGMELAAVTHAKAASPAMVTQPKATPKMRCGEETKPPVRRRAVFASGQQPTQVVRATEVGGPHA